MKAVATSVAPNPITDPMVAAQCWRQLWDILLAPIEHAPTIDEPASGATSNIVSLPSKKKGNAGTTKRTKATKRQVA